MNDLTPTHATLVEDLRQLIADARLRAAASVNAELTGLYWQVGRRIHREILGSERAEYGEEIFSTLSSKQLKRSTDGRGFSAQNLRHMVRFAQAFPEEAIVSTLSRQLSWSHLKELLYVDDPLKRDFYVELCRLEAWSVRQLRERVQSLSTSVLPSPGSPTTPSGTTSKH